jgi:hypothetical protein
MTGNTTSIGQQGLNDDSTEFNAIMFMMRQLISRVSTCMPVQVVAVTNSGGISAVGYVDVQPLVNQTDGNDNATPHGVLHGLPYCRLQGGSSAVILDPVVGDIGVAVFASRDMSRVKKTKAQASPGSRRRYSMADGVYIQGMLNGTPTQYVAFAASGITIVSPNLVSIQAPMVKVN